VCSQASSALTESPEVFPIRLVLCRGLLAACGWDDRLAFNPMRCFGVLGWRHGVSGSLANLFARNVQTDFESRQAGQTSMLHEADGGSLAHSGLGG